MARNRWNMLTTTLIFCSMHFCRKGKPATDTDAQQKEGRVAAHISVIVPVLNETARIHTCVAHARAASEGWPLEILVVDGDPAGGTVATITEPTVRTAIAPRGRGPQLNYGASLASGKILVFVHADTLLPAKALDMIKTAVGATPEVYGAFNLGIASSRRVFRHIESSVKIRTRLTRIPYGDQAIFMTRRLFERLGGYPNIPIMEDVALMRRAKAANARFALIDALVRTSARRWTSEGVLYCTLRNWLLLSLYLAGIQPERLIKYYRRH